MSHSIQKENLNKSLNTPSLMTNAQAPTQATILELLSKTIHERKRRYQSSKNTENSYTAKLFSRGLDRQKGISAKIIEESAELLEAADLLQAQRLKTKHIFEPPEKKRQQLVAQERQQHVCHEFCDLLFHMLVLAEYSDVTLKQIQSELCRRWGTSGLEEKQMRKRNT